MSHRKLWDEEQYLRQLGQEGYAFFSERAEKIIQVCAGCKGTGEISVRDTLREDGTRKAHHRQAEKIVALRGTPEPFVERELWRTVRCPACAEKLWRLFNFARLWCLTVPPAYRFAILSKLRPYEGAASVVSMERQQKILDVLRANPGKGYAFFGPAHCGKTVWSTALYVENLWQAWMREGGWRGKAPVRRISAKKLLDEHTDYAMRRYDKDDEGDSVVDEPSVTADKIVKLRQQGRTYRLFLEEIDKVKETESRRSTLFDIINTLVEQEGVLVINSNLTYAEFQAQFGEDFAWRVGRLCTVVDLFEEKK